MEVSSTRYVQSKEVQGEDVRSDEPDSKLKQASAAMKRISKSRKSKHQFSNPSLTTSDDAATPTPICFSWLHRMLCYLLLILLGGACGAMWSVIVDEVVHGHIDATVSDSVNKRVDSAMSGSMNNDSLNELPR